MTKSGVPCQADLYTPIERRGRRGANGKMSGGRQRSRGDGGLDIGGGAARCAKPLAQHRCVCVCNV